MSIFTSAPSPGLRLDRELLRLRCGCGLRDRRADHELDEEPPEQARALFGRGRGRRLAGLISQTVGLRLLCQLGLDLAHLNEAERTPRARRVDAVLGREHDGDEEGRGDAGGDQGRTDELGRGRELGPGGYVGVVHRLLAFPV
jgi:hypothetical protein